MPSINLTDRQLCALSAALAVTLEVDETFGTLESLGAISYQAMLGEHRRELDELRQVIDAVAKEHA